MGDVIDIGGITRLDLPVERVLNAAVEKDLESVIIIGYRKDGGEYFASSYADGAAVVWHLERAKFKLMIEAEPKEI